METWTTKDGKEIRAERKRTHRVTLRLTDEELEAFKAKANSAGMSQQEFARRSILGQTIINTGDLKEIAPQLGKIGANLNQIAKALNGSRYYDFNLVTQNQKELMEIWQLLRRFLAEHR